MVAVGIECQYVKIIPDREERKIVNTCVVPMISIICSDLSELQ